MLFLFEKSVLTEYLRFVKLIKFFGIIKLLILKEWRENELQKSLKKQCPEAIFRDNIQVQGDIKNLSIAKSTRVGGGVYFNLGGKKHGGEGRITIGENTIIAGRTTLFAGGGSIDIGSNCEIGGSVIITSHAVNRDYKIQINEKNLDGKFWHHSIQLGENCHIGSGAILAGDVKLGINCNVAAGAVVTGCFGDNLVLVGNPARPIPK